MPKHLSPGTEKLSSTQQMFNLGGSSRIHACMTGRHSCVGSGWLHKLRNLCLFWTMNPSTQTYNMPSLRLHVWAEYDYSVPFLVQFCPSSLQNHIRIQTKSDQSPDKQPRGVELIQDDFRSIINRGNHSMDSISILILLLVVYFLGLVVTFTYHFNEVANNRSGRPEAIQRLLELLDQDAILRLFYPIVYISHVLLWPIAWSMVWIVWASSAPKICGFSRRRAEHYSRIPNGSLEEANIRGLEACIDLSSAPSGGSSIWPLPHTLNSHAKMDRAHSQTAEDMAFPTSAPPPAYEA